jgi:hypothetical protein
MKSFLTGALLMLAVLFLGCGEPRTTQPPKFENPKGTYAWFGEKAETASRRVAEDPSCVVIIRARSTNHNYIHINVNAHCAHSDELALYGFTVIDDSHELINNPSLYQAFYQPIVLQKREGVWKAINLIDYRVLKNPAL